MDAFEKTAFPKDPLSQSRDIATIVKQYHAIWGHYVRISIHKFCPLLKAEATGSSNSVVSEFLEAAKHTKSNVFDNAHGVDSTTLTSASVLGNETGSILAQL